jgi:oligopeptide/dipeptide ABC transporter ATP-binding protein
MMAPLLEIRGLTVSYRRGKAVTLAVRDVTFEVGPGETVGLVGESGSGKSTIARAVLGLAPIQSGSVRFRGEDISRLDFDGRRRLYRHVQLVFQDPYSSLNPSRTIGRTLAEPLQAYGERDRAVVQARVRGMLDRVRLPGETADRYPSELSGGQRQRVAIARALMLSPQLVILDEPLSALDLSVQAQILNLLRELQATSGLSYVFISHDLEVVRYLCDRVVVMYQGRIVETGLAGRVSSQPAHPYTYMLHQASPVPDPRSQRQRHPAAAGLPVRPPGRRQPGAGQCDFAPRCPYAVSRCRTEAPALRAVADQTAAACHRFPQWQAEVQASPHDGAGHDCVTWQSTRLGAEPALRLESLGTTPTGRNGIDDALHEGDD